MADDMSDLRRLDETASLLQAMLRGAEDPVPSLLRRYSGYLAGVLAVTLATAGRFGEAHRKFMDAGRSFGMSVRTDHANLQKADIHARLARVLAALPSEPESLVRQFLAAAAEEFVTHLGYGHHHTAAAVVALATVGARRGDAAVGSAHVLTALQTCIARHGSRSSAAADLESAAASAAAAAAEPAAAVRHGLAAVAGYELSLGDSLETSDAHTHLGGLHFDRGDAESALACAVAASSIRGRLLGQTHPSWAASRHNAGLALYALKRHADAAEAFGAALATREAAFGPDALPTVLSALHLGMALTPIPARRRDALPHLSLALRVGSDALGPHSLVASCARAALGEYYAHEDPAEARRHYEAAWTSMSAHLPAGDLTTARTAHAYARLLKEVDSPRALFLLRSSYEARLACLPSDSVEIGSVANSIASLMLDTDRRSGEEALLFLRKARDVYAKQPGGAGAGQLRAVCRNLESLLRRLGRPLDALEAAMEAEGPDDAPRLSEEGFWAFTATHDTLRAIALLDRAFQAGGRVQGGAGPQSPTVLSHLQVHAQLLSQTGAPAAKRLAVLGRIADNLGVIEGGPRGRNAAAALDSLCGLLMESQRHKDCLPYATAAVECWRAAAAAESAPANAADGLGAAVARLGLVLLSLGRPEDALPHLMATWGRRLAAAGPSGVLADDAVGALHRVVTCAIDAAATGPLAGRQATYLVATSAIDAASPRLARQYNGLGRPVPPHAVVSTLMKGVELFHALGKPEQCRHARGHLLPMLLRVPPPAEMPLAAWTDKMMKIAMTMVKPVDHADLQRLLLRNADLHAAAEGPDNAEAARKFVALADKVACAKNEDLTWRDDE